VVDGPVCKEASDGVDNKLGRDGKVHAGEVVGELEARDVGFPVVDFVVPDGDVLVVERFGQLRGKIDGRLAWVKRE
jgi:hypothetical protein